MPSGLKPQYDVYPLTPALRLGLVTVLSELGFSPDSACTELVEVSNNKFVQIIYCQSLMGALPLDKGSIVSFRSNTKYDESIPEYIALNPPFQHNVLPMPWIGYYR